MRSDVRIALWQSRVLTSENDDDDDNDNDDNDDDDDDDDNNDKTVLCTNKPMVISSFCRTPSFVYYSQVFWGLGILLHQRELAPGDLVT